MDQFEYIKILEKYVSVASICPRANAPEMGVSQDNDSKHRNKRATSWFWTKSIEVMEWPGQSPNRPNPPTESILANYITFPMVYNLFGLHNATQHFFSKCLNRGLPLDELQ